MKAAKQLTLEQMLDLGMHFGHKKERSHAAAKEYIYCVKDGIAIIDLDKTTATLEAARDYFAKAIKEGKTILFVATKVQARKIVKEVAQNLEMPYVTHKWLGGTLTNFETILKSLKKLENLKQLAASDQFNKLIKRERSRISNQITNMEEVLSGISKMQKLPDVLFVIDANREHNAIEEGRKMDVPVIALCDTNANPKLIDYPVVANDDAPKAIAAAVSLICGVEVEPVSDLREEIKND